MTEITTTEVQHLARLSSLQLSDDEAVTLRQDVQNILNYVDQLAELDTEGIEPTYQVTDLQNVWRNDEVDTYGVGRDALLDLAPEVEANQIKDQIATYIAKCVKDAYTNQSLWINNKPPTQSYIENTVKIVGNTIEDAIYLKELSDTYREKWRIYEESKALLESMKDRISVFQTLSSNKRSGF